MSVPGASEWLMLFLPISVKARHKRVDNELESNRLLKELFEVSDFAFCSCNTNEGVGSPSSYILLGWQLSRPRAQKTRPLKVLAVDAKPWNQTRFWSSLVQYFRSPLMALLVVVILLQTQDHSQKKWKEEYAAQCATSGWTCTFKDRLVVSFEELTLESSRKTKLVIAKMQNEYLLNALTYPMNWLIIYFCGSPNIPNVDVCVMQASHRPC